MTDKLFEKKIVCLNEKSQTIRTSYESITVETKDFYSILKWSTPDDETKQKQRL